MSTTLTNGLKLPDKGSVDWYADMQNNYTILDGAVGTVAEHTTALAGKAPAVHTHTKSDITDFPAYGTTAGTICEGNDNRLSDARTPVAHTHTKSDVTDLLNSHFIPSANNSYDLGSSSYQWKSVYAQFYYYNGVAWGLDKVNVWRDDQVLDGLSVGRTLRLRRPTVTLGNPPPESGFTEIGNYCFSDKNNVNFGFINLRDYANGNTSMALLCRQRYSNGVRDISGNNKDASVVLEVDSSLNYNFYPNGNGTHNLGTSTNKWKSLNGINPGALSLPNLSVSQNVDTNGWVYNWTTLNSVLLNSGDTNVTKNGWLYIRTNNTVAGDRVAVRLKNVTAEDPTTIAGEIGFGHIEIFVPLVAGYQAYVFTNKAPTYIKFYPCLGNVPSGV